MAHDAAARRHRHTPSVASDPRTIDDLVDELRARGQRATVARRAVLEALLEAGDAHLTADELAPRVREHFMGGVRSGVNGTPTFFINGVRHDGGFDYQSLLEAINEQL